MIIPMAPASMILVLIASVLSRLCSHLPFPTVG
jgi:hypothetical protein